MYCRRIVAVGLLIALLLTVSAKAGGLDGETNTDGFNPAVELYSIAEAQRLGHVARQRALVDALGTSLLYWPGDLWGAPVGVPPIRQPIGYETKQLGPERWMYRPLYDPPVVVEAIGDAEVSDVPLEGANAVTSPKGATDRPQLPAPRDARQGDFIPPTQQPDGGGPALPKPTGPREF